MAKDNTANFQADLAFRRDQLAQQKTEAAALAVYRLYRTQLIERGMLALEADKAAREMALNVANTTYQQEMGRAQAVLNAPRGPADWAAYANRLRGLQQSGELPGVLGSLALPGRTALYSNGGQAPPVPLTNTQMADAATLSLASGIPGSPELVGPTWATQQLAAQPYQAPATFPAYYGNPTEVPKAPVPAAPAGSNPPGYDLWPKTPVARPVSALQGAPAAQQKIGMMVEPTQATQAYTAADLFGQQQAQNPVDAWYSQMANQLMDPSVAYGDPELAQAQATGDPAVVQATMTRRQARMADRQARRAAREGTAVPAQAAPAAQQYAAAAPTQSYAYSDPYAGYQTQQAGDLFGLSSNPSVGTQGVSAQASSPYGGPVAVNPNQRGLYGYNVSYQNFRNLSPTEQELMTGYAEEGAGGFEPQSKDDFLAGMVRAAPNYAPAKVARYAGIN